MWVPITEGRVFAEKSTGGRLKCFHFSMNERLRASCNSDWDTVELFDGTHDCVKEANEMRWRILSLV